MLIYVIGLENEGYVSRSVFLLSGPESTRLGAFEQTDCLPRLGWTHNRRGGWKTTL
jgi:hypothetical protein